MSLHESAAAIRQRLQNPANAVADTAIDLRRKKIDGVPLVPQEIKKPEPVEAVERPSVAAVRVEIAELEHRLKELRQSIHMPEPEFTTPTMPEILRAVAKAYRVTTADILSPRRTLKYIRPRHVAFYLACSLTTHSTPAVGRIFGGKDHTTVMHGRDRIIGGLEYDADLRVEVEALIEQLRRPVEATHEPPAA